MTYWFGLVLILFCSQLKTICCDIKINLYQIEYLLKNNVKFTAPPQLTPDGYAKVTFCEDPDGTPIELVEVINPN